MLKDISSFDLHVLLRFRSEEIAAMAARDTYLVEHSGSFH